LTNFLDIFTNVDDVNERRTTCCCPPLELIDYRAYVLSSFCLVTDRQSRVVVPGVVEHRQCHISVAVAAVPADRHAVAINGRAIDAGQAVVDSVVARHVVVAAVIYKLSVYQSVVVIVEHHVGPVEVEHGHISQVDDAVGIAVDVVTAVVQVVERSLIEGAEYQTQDAVDNGSSGVGVPSSGNDGTVPCPRSGAVYTHGRRQRTAPVVVHVVPGELVAVVVAAVVKAVVGIVAMVAVVAVTIATVITTVTVAAVIAIAAVVSIVTVATMVAIVAITFVVATVTAATVIALTATVASTGLINVATVAVGASSALVVTHAGCARSCAGDVLVGARAHSSRGSGGGAAINGSAACASSTAGSGDNGRLLGTRCRALTGVSVGAGAGGRTIHLRRSRALTAGACGRAADLRRGRALTAGACGRAADLRRSRALTASAGGRVADLRRCAASTRSAHVASHRRSLSVS